MHGFVSPLFEKKVKNFYLCIQMSQLVRHIEYLLMHHDCVVIPGLGALVKRYMPAFYDEKSDVVKAPGAELTFNSEISYDDGLLASSISRRERITYTEAVRILADEAAAMKAQLDYDGEFSLGSLGKFVKKDGAVDFIPLTDCYHLIDVNLQPQVVAVDDYDESAENVVPVLSRFSTVASRIAATIAIVFVIGFTLYNPARVGEGVMKASFLPDLRIAHATPESQVAVEEFDQDIIVTPATEELSDTSAEIISSPDETVAVAGDTVDSEPSQSLEPAEGEDFSYYMIVASLPTQELADRFISDNSLTQASVLIADGRYRVWLKAGNSYSEAYDNYVVEHFPDAWVYRKN